MDRPDLYDRDILAWSEQQAAALRRLASSRDLPNDLDLDNVVEEIESAGRSELRATESFIELILAHLVQAVSDPGSNAVAHWRAKCVGWRAQLLRTFSPVMRQRIDMDLVWQSALQQADAALAEHSVQLAAGLAGPCPLALDDLLCSTFEFRDVVRRAAQPGS